MWIDGLINVNRLVKEKHIQLINNLTSGEVTSGLYFKVYQLLLKMECCKKKF